MNAVEAPVKKSIAVKASVEHAFKVFTEGFDTGGRGPSHRQAAARQSRHRNHEAADVSGARPTAPMRLGSRATWEPPHVRAGLANQIPCARPTWQSQRGGGSIHGRAGRHDPRRSRTSPFRAARRRTQIRCESEWTRQWLDGCMQQFAADRQSPMLWILTWSTPRCSVRQVNGWGDVCACRDRHDRNARTRITSASQSALMASSKRRRA